MVKQLDSLGWSSSLSHLLCLPRRWDSGGAHCHFIISAMTGENPFLKDAMFGAYNGILLPHNATFPQTKAVLSPKTLGTPKGPDLQI